MKKIIFALALVVISVDMMALSRAKVREYARFLSDRMAYELDLSSGQYDDCYEINYDFVNAVGDLLDDMETGDSRALDDYYVNLDYRNEDLSYVLSSYQYNRFVSTECFYRPFCIYDGAWAFRPYMVYSNRTYFYMSLPIGYNGYFGAHARRYYSAGFYVGRYSGSRYDFTPIRRHRNYQTFRQRDFGPVFSGHGNPGRPSYRPQPRPISPSVNPSRPQGRPNANRVQPARPQNRPDGNRVQPNRTQNRPDGSNVKPDRSQNRSDGNRVQPNRQQERTNDSRVSPDKSQGRSEGSGVKQGGRDNGSHQGGGGVVRRGRG